LQDAPGELASKDVATRLQAANMLGGIITSSPQYAQSAVDLLTHFVRTEAPVKPLSVHAEPACSAIPPLADDIQSALTALGSEAAQHTRVDLSRTELARADFISGPHLKQAKFDGADLHCTNINNADFRLASMTSADLTDIKDAKPSFAGTALTGAWVNSSRFYLNGQPKQDQVHQSMHYNCVK
jgi:hypothetical protein